MGWTGHELTNGGWKLYTRGGTCGVYIKHDNRNEAVSIPSDLLRTLVAEDIRSHRVNELENMGDDEILGLPCEEEEDE